MCVCVCRLCSGRQKVAHVASRVHGRLNLETAQIVESDFVQKIKGAPCLLERENPKIIAAHCNNADRRIYKRLANNYPEPT